jgi:hypothetical protein
LSIELDENEYCIVDALQATVDGKSVSLIHGEKEVKGILVFQGSYKACVGYCKRMGTVKFEIKKLKGRQPEQSVFQMALTAVRLKLKVIRPSYI